MKKPPSPRSTSRRFNHHSRQSMLKRELEELGGRGFLETITQKFVGDGLHCLTLIEQAVDTQNVTQLQETGHGLKGIAGNMGADSLANIAVYIESACRTGELATPADLADLELRFQAAFHQTRKERWDVVNNGK